MGYAGKSILDSGRIYAPYVPLQSTGTFLDLIPDEPSAVDRLAGTIDPEARKRCDEIDEARKKWRDRHEFKVETFDFVADPSLPSAVPGGSA